MSWKISEVMNENLPTKSDLFVNKTVRDFTEPTGGDMSKQSSMTMFPVGQEWLSDDSNDSVSSRTMS